ncbi:LacI family DNA-binding transcriptional regulator [Fusibacter sp. JL298sf-3]
MRTTIKDIAEFTGLSTTTISLVLNGKGDKIPDKTKKLIFQAAEELAYTPNQVAVGLVKKQTKTLGLIISDVRNVFFANLAKGVEDECRRNGWTLILCNTSDSHERDLAYIQMLADKGVDGILYAMSVDSNREKTLESMEKLRRVKMPYIMVDRIFEEGCCHYISTDHESGGYLATAHLLDLGHRAIACVTGPKHLDDSNLRLAGYKKALAAYGVPYDETLVVEGHYTLAGGKAAVEQLLKTMCTAIFAFNDLSAYGVYHALKAKGYAIPSDYALVGYDDIFFSDLLDVPLTTVHQPIYEIGVDATKTLIEEIVPKKNADYFNKKVAPTLVVRQSTSRL